MTASLGIKMRSFLHKDTVIEPNRPLNLVQFYGQLNSNIWSFFNIQIQSYDTYDVFLL